MNYVQDLVNLICGTTGETPTDGQIDIFIKKTMKNEYDVQNGNPPSGKTDGTERFKNLQSFGPKDVSQVSKGLSWVNDPDYQSNMIDRLNTPFDHVERILLQDFSETMGLSGSGNYFKELIDIGRKEGSEYGMKHIQLQDKSESGKYPFPGELPNFDFLNEKFRNGDFFIDSFTYTPFIDYSQTEYSEGEDADIKKTGVYSDQFLNDYNCGRYEESYGEGKKEQVDTHRHTLSSNLFTLRNLEKDIQDAKIAFRDAIDRDNPEAETDAKVYIYTFCEHLATLFAKLSNIRMSHEIYGFKHPHSEWEGILALDIWYQMLYHRIDEQYPFDDRLMNMNPMSRRKIVGGKVEWNGKNLTRQGIETLGLEWIEDASAPGYAYIWNQNMFDDFDRNANDISDQRMECVTPRGVLKKMYDLVYVYATEQIPSEIVRTVDGDFEWFKQNGNVYSDSDKSTFTKYVNLHIGRAFDLMSPKDYQNEIAHKEPEDGVYRKDFHSQSPEDQIELKSRMVTAGYYALYDAFCVLKNERIFNIFNSDSNKVELFDPRNAKCYSQGQCAIVIERVFSRIYKYLQFKSTTGEVFQTHVNIDSGYKYLETSALEQTDNPISKTYYDDEDSVPYVRYLNKVWEYVNQEPEFLTDDEHEVLSQFVKVLSKKPAEWLGTHWNLCLLCTQVSDSLHSLMAIPPQERKAKLNLLARAPEDEYQGEVQEQPEVENVEEETPVTRTVVVNLSLTHGKWDTGAIAGLSGMRTVYAAGKPIALEFQTTARDSEYRFNVSQVRDVIALNPYYQDSGVRVDYELSGLSLTRNGTSNFELSSAITADDFGGSNILHLYAVWDVRYIVEFNPGEIQAIGEMQTFSAPAESVILLDRCTYELPPECLRRRIQYFNSESGAWEPREDQDLQDGDEVWTYKFDGWIVSAGGRTWDVEGGARVVLPRLGGDVPPVATFTAKWTPAYSAVTFMVGGEKYCDLLLDMGSRTLDMYPDQPSMVDTQFLWWDTAIGSYISTGDTNQNAIVCGDDQEPVVWGDEAGSENPDIVCENGEYLLNGTKVHAILQGQEISEEDKVTVTFRYMKLDSQGQVVTDSTDQETVYNAHIPNFHIHQEIPFTDQEKGYKFVFRYWKLESGTVTSSLTVLSDVVLNAVYDQVVVPTVVDQEWDEPEESRLYGEFSQDDALSLNSCDNLDQSNRDECAYCKYQWIDPKTGSGLGKEEVKCPYVRLLLDGEITSEDDTFAPMTLLEIDDISNLLKALFKINIDIAHKEYFLKIDVPQKSDWWYGEKFGKEQNDIPTICYQEGENRSRKYADEDPAICDSPSDQIVCRSTDDTIICSYNGVTQIVCLGGDVKWVSFEPTVEFKFSNFHAANQIVEGNLVCTTSGSNILQQIVPVNRELLDDQNGNHYNDFYYYYDYRKSLAENFVKECSALIDDNGFGDITPVLSTPTKYYQLQPLPVYQNSSIQSPVDVNDFIRNRHGSIPREKNQIRTFVATVKKYRPVIMPEVRDIFDQCQGAETKYEADVTNDYGVFGWCTIPSKTMVNMEYNEQSIIVPSSYDHHNRIGGSNFLQMDKDLKFIYTRWDQVDPDNEDDKTGILTWNAKNTWYYLYNTRDWTYFLLPFFNVKQNSELYSYMLDTYFLDPDDKDWRPANSDHINGVIFEPSNEGRTVDTTFGDIASSCEFLAKYHHNENNLRILSERYTNLLSYSKLKELTQTEGGEFNSFYGSAYELPEDFRLPFQDWVDDYDKTGSYVDLKIGDYSPDLASRELKYRYNLGQSHAIDDFDENSVWFYITMVEPIEELNQVIELEDIMPFVFWWENRGEQNNGPSAVCYGRSSSAKLNYELGGWCYSNPLERDMTEIDVDQNVKSNGKVETEHLWHAVQHTIGTDFSNKEYGGTVLTSDNSGNVYKGAFDPNCSGTDEKWKIHHPSNAFGANQGEDPTEDKYHLGYKTHGDGEFPSVVPEGMNDLVLDSLQDRPMTWNLWNVVRHYVYMKKFKNLHRALGSEKAAWQELENQTKKIVKGIYRTFQQRKYGADRGRSTFGDIDGSSTNYGGTCLVQWTNSFVEINTILERNAREHQASFVLFTGDQRKLDTSTAYGEYGNVLKFKSGVRIQDRQKVCVERAYYDAIRGSKFNFRVLTLDGVDEEDDGMRPRKEVDGEYVWDKPVELEEEPDPNPCNVFQGYKYDQLPTTYVIGDSEVYNQQLPDVDINFLTTLDLDREFPESEYHLNSTTQKWVRRIRNTVMNRQVFPVYTSMESMDKSHHDLTVSDMKGITFQVVPQFYWKYEWSFNEFMIHRVGRLQSPSKDIVMYDMLGNVWEWVRDDWADNVSILNGKCNPINGTRSAASEPTPKKTIKGGAFDQFCRKVISPAREELSWDKFRSKYGTQANVGFRPSMVYSSVGEGGFTPGEDPVDIFFLFDASASQDSEITKMLDSAKNIVKMFSGSEEKKDVCHVGSALFLGPTIKMMCCKQVVLFSQRGWWKYTTTATLKTSKHSHEPKVEYSTDWKSYEENYPWKMNSRYDGRHSWVEKGGIISGRGDWIELNNSDGNKSRDQSFWSGTGANGKPAGLWNKFKDFRDSVWMAGEETSSRGIEEVMDGVEAVVDTNDETLSYDEIETLSGPDDLAEVDLNEEQSEEVVENASYVKLMGSRDGASVPGAGYTGPGGDYGKIRYPSKVEETDHIGGRTKYINIFCGVPAWHENDTLHFGEIGADDQEDWSRYSYKVGNTSVDGADMFKSRFNFFSYDPTQNGIASFDWPFWANVASDKLSSYKGVLSNWWAGCEPSCDMLSKLLRYQCFYGYPYHIGIGYLFRKNTPRLVFVFTNEYDNSMIRHWTYEGGSSEKEIVYVPSAQSEGGKVTLITNTTGILGSDQNAPDPYCLQLLRGYTSSSAQSYEKYLESLDLDPREDYIRQGVDALNWLGMNSGLSSITKLTYGEPDGQKVNTNSNWKFGNSQTIAYQVVGGYGNSQVANLDINGLNSPLGSSGRPLTQYQMKYVQDHQGKLPGVHYGNPDKKGIVESTSFDYHALKTMGFYQLNIALHSHVNYPLNAYFMLQDANAPTPLFGVGDDPDFDDVDVRNRVAASMFPEKDVRMFKDIASCPLPDEIDQYLKSNGVTADKKHMSGGKLTWNVIRGLAAQWHSQQMETTLDPSSKEASAVDKIFGLENPYEKTTIVFGRRPNYLSLSREAGWKKNKASFKISGKTTVYYPYLLGLPMVSEVRTAWANKGNKWKEFKDRKDGEETPEVVVEEDTEFKVGLSRWMRWNIWTKHNATVPADWPVAVHYWAYSSKDLNDQPPIPEEGKLWIDQHLCPWVKKTTGARTSQGKMNRNNLTEQSVFLMGFTFTKYPSSDDPSVWKFGIGSKFYPCPISLVFSSESFCPDWQDGSLTNYVWNKRPHEYVTITYRKKNPDDENGEPIVTGSMKIIMIQDQGSPKRYDSEKKKRTVNNGGIQLNVTRGFGGSILRAAATKGLWTEYPQAWKSAAKVFSQKYSGIVTSSSSSVFVKKKVIEFVYNFYKNIKRAMPSLLGYRFQNQIMSQYTNMDGKSVVDYEDEDNSVIIKSLPIMDVEKMKDTFQQSFGAGGQLNASKSFSYTHCVVDLNPELAEYNSGLSPEANPDLFLENGKFPMKFALIPDVNVDEYKKSKLVLSRIDGISGEKFDTYTMGSRTSDYDKVVDPWKLKYRDEDSVVSGSVNVNASVTMGNGGSYQKKRVDVDFIKINDGEIEHPSPNDDLFWIDVDERDRMGRLVDVNKLKEGDSGFNASNIKKTKKYFRNKQFFMDPFELTIAQWCYVKLNSQYSGKADKEQARALLGANCSQIENSYWRYLIAWENSDWIEEKVKWTESNKDTDRSVSTFMNDWKVSVPNFIGDWKQQNPIKVGETEDDWNQRAEDAFNESALDAAKDEAKKEDGFGRTDDIWVQLFNAEKWYNPLEDTRPYYYATYQDVRGTPQVYADVQPGGNGYVIDSGKGDEFQMNTRTGDQAVSFMDILNGHVVRQAQKRVYGTGQVKSVSGYENDFAGELTPEQIEEKVTQLKGDEYDEFGESPLMPYLMEARDIKLGLSRKERKRTWCQGKIGGINFDLPTEAQWEYCCRAGSESAFPRENNLGLNFEERNQSLDLIAWYKYKVIGSLPEPERFCTWRISRMLFGISKDKEQINNVYEYQN